MKTALAALVLLASLASLGFRGRQAAPVATNPPAKAAALALQLTNELAQGKNQAVYAHFSPKMKAAVSPAALGGLWKQFEAKFGAFQKAESAGGSAAQGYDQQLVQSVFAHKTVTLLWTLDAKDLSVAGLHVQAIR